MLSRIFLIIACFCITFPAIAQDDMIPAQMAKHAIFVELGGMGILYSVNYERVFDGRYSLRGGVAAYPESGFLGRIIIIPVVANYLIQFNQRSYIEFGIGGAFVDWEHNKPSFHVFPSIGARNQNMLKSGFIGRMFVLPYYSEGIGVYPGVSVGYGF